MVFSFPPAIPACWPAIRGQSADRNLASRVYLSRPLPFWRCSVRTGRGSTSLSVTQPKFYLPTHTHTHRPCQSEGPKAICENLSPQRRDAKVVHEGGFFFLVRNGSTVRVRIFCCCSVLCVFFYFTRGTAKGCKNETHRPGTVSMRSDFRLFLKTGFPRMPSSA